MSGSRHANGHASAPETPASSARRLARASLRLHGVRPVPYGGRDGGTPGRSPGASPRPLPQPRDAALAKVVAAVQESATDAACEAQGAAAIEAAVRSLVPKGRLSNGAVLWLQAIASTAGDNCMLSAVAEIVEYAAGNHSATLETLHDAVVQSGVAAGLADDTPLAPMRVAELCQRSLAGVHSYAVASAVAAVGLLDVLGAGRVDARLATRPRRPSRRRADASPGIGALTPLPSPAQVERRRRRAEYGRLP